MPLVVNAHVVLVLFLERMETNQQEILQTGIFSEPVAAKESTERETPLLFPTLVSYLNFCSGATFLATLSAPLRVGICGAAPDS